MSSDLLRIAVSGLIANQSSLTTTGHNIANAGVDGYSRQRVELATRDPQFINGGYFGRGVDVSTVTRAVDEFAVRQMRIDTWTFNAADTLRSYSEQIDGILNDPSVSVSTRLDSFFSALQAASNDPVWLPTRQVVLGEADTLAKRFNSVYARLQEINSSINTQLTGVANEISSLASGIADLNLKIEIAFGTGGQDAPNDLLDKRDEALLKLSELVDITTVQDGNSINVLLGKGQNLVVGSNANSVVTTPGRFDPSRSDLAIVVNGVPRAVTGIATGGKLGGMLDFRNRILDQAFNQLGRVALGVAADVNAQHELGVDIEGDLGGLFFNDVNDQLSTVLRARAANDNDPASTGVVTVTVDDTSKLTASSYQLDVLAGGAWRLFRNSDNTVVASGAALTDPLITVDGITLHLNIPAGNFVDGDSYLIEPTRFGAKDIALAIDRPEDIALAQPVRVDAQVGNLGTATASVPAVFDTAIPLFTATPGQLSPPLLIRFSSPTTFDVLDNTDPSNPVALVPPLTGLAFTPGVTNSLFSTNPADPDYFGFQVEVSGDPQAGDRFALSFNSKGVSDNRNALALAKLQTADNLVNNTATYQSAYGQMVGFVGTETRRARVDTESGSVLLEQSKAAREARSGVNMDEEAANLVRFEQAYNATAQLITVARNVIDTLLKVTE